MQLPNLTPFISTRRSEGSQGIKPCNPFTALQCALEPRSGTFAQPQITSFLNLRITWAIGHANVWASPQTNKTRSSGGDPRLQDVLKLHDRWPTHPGFPRTYFCIFPRTFQLSAWKVLGLRKHLSSGQNWKSQVHGTCANQVVGHSIHVGFQCVAKLDNCCSLSFLETSPTLIPQITSSCFPSISSLANIP